MFDFYNEHFFDDSITAKIELSNRMTKTIGKFCPSDMKIVFSEIQAMNVFNKGQREHESGGIKVYDRVMFLQLVMEHEMVHAAVFKSQSMKNKNLNPAILKSHGTFFRDLIRALFGHTEIKCKMHDTCVPQKCREDFMIGQMVSFKSKDGVVVTGKMIKRNPKTSTILVENIPGIPNGNWKVSYACLS